MQLYKIYNKHTGGSSKPRSEKKALSLFNKRGGIKAGLVLIPVKDTCEHMFTIGETYKIPSGMGGVFLIVFEYYKNNRYYFRIITPGFERQISYTKEEAKSKIQKAY